ncbi:MAG: PQQ-binding-like beta-propeller repeat protein [Gammaproteobacteria bacterium]
MKRLYVLVSAVSAGFLFFCAVTAAGASPAFGPSDWTQYRMGPTHNAVFENGSPALPDRHFGTDGQVRATPVIVGDRLFIGNHESGGMFSFNVITGEQYWGNLGPWWRHVPNWIHADMIYVSGRLFVAYGNRIFDNDQVRGTGLSGVMAVDPNTGETIWNHLTLGESMPTPAYWQGDLFVATGAGELLALDTRTGQLDWSLKLPGWVSMSSPAIAGHVLYVGALNSVIAVDLETHRKLWEHDEYGSFTDVSPAVSPEGVVVITAKKSRDQLTAEEARKYKAMRGNLDFIYGFDARSGKLLWKKLMGGGPDQNNNTAGAPTIADGRAYVGSPYTDTFYAFDIKTGRMIWERNVRAGIKGAPVVFDGNVFFGDTNGYLHVLDADTGARVRRASGYVVPKLKLGGSVSASPDVALSPGGPVIINQNVFVGSQDGFVYSVSIPDWLRN